MKSTVLRFWVPVCAAVLVLSGCKNEEQTTRIRELEEESSQRQIEVDSLNNQLRTIEADRDKLREELDQLKHDAAAMKEQLAVVEREKNAAAKVEASNKTTPDTPPKLTDDDAKKLVRDHMAAVWTIQAETNESRGVIVAADGKTWLYMPAMFLSNSPKLVVKDAAGTQVTKFGEFQLAADANIARLEITQDVTNQVTLDPKAALGEQPRLLVAVRTAGSAAPKIEEVSPGTINDTDIELSTYNLGDTSGDPVFNAETGALVAITNSAQGSLTTLWDDPSQNTSQRAPSPALRVDRKITWKPGTFGAMAAERRKINELNASSRLMLAAALLKPQSNGLQAQGTIPDSNKTVAAVLQENKTVPAVQQLLKLNENLTAKKVRMSDKDLNRQFVGLLGSIGTANRRIATELRAMKTSPPLSRDSENALKWNEQAEQKLLSLIESIH